MHISNVKRNNFLLFAPMYVQIHSKRYDLFELELRLFVPVSYVTIISKNTCKISYF